MEQKVCDVENWKPIPGFGGIYEVSSWGRVYINECVRLTAKGRRKNFGAKFLASRPTGSYPWVALCHPVTRERRHVTIHLLVAEAFLGSKPTSEHEVNHKDGDKTNAHHSNLEWVTHPENCIHAYKIGLRDKKGRFVTLGSETKRASDWAKIFKIKPQTVYGRLSNGWPAEVVFNEEKARAYRGAKISLGKIKHAPKYKDGLTSTNWAKKLGITRSAFLWRVKNYQFEKQIYKQGVVPYPRQTKKVEL